MDKKFKKEIAKILKKYNCKSIDGLGLNEWLDISIDEKLSEPFIREFKNSVIWDYISEYQKLSESFIKEFRNRVNWEKISKYQKLSESFIREFFDKLDKEALIERDLIKIEYIIKPS